MAACRNQSGDAPSDCVRTVESSAVVGQVALRVWPINRIGAVGVGTFLTQQSPSALPLGGAYLVATGRIAGFVPGRSHLAQLNVGKAK